MIGGKMEKALNGQINAELYSSYLYLSMAAYFESMNLHGFAHWMKLQAEEENGHAMKIYDYVIERGGTVVLEKIEAPPQKWNSPLAVFEDAYAHEQKITGLINDLVNLALAEGDHATRIFLDWFVSEQVEEESSVDEVVQKLGYVRDSKGGLLMLDHRLRKRGSDE